MIRYVAIAAAIVVATIFVILALGRTTKPHDAVYSAKLASPGVPRREGDAGATAVPLSGDAPWALSALPDCFRQLHAIHGPPDYVNAHLAQLAPPRATWHRARSGRLRSADCVVTIVGASANVVRGDTRLHIPADARFSIAGPRLILDRFSGGTEDLRVYERRDGNAPAFDN